MKAPHQTTGWRVGAIQNVFPNNEFLRKQHLTLKNQVLFEDTLRYKKNAFIEIPQVKISVPLCRNYYNKVITGK